MASNTEAETKEEEGGEEETDTQAGAKMKTSGEMKCKQVAK